MTDPSDISPAIEIKYAIAVDQELVVADVLRSLALAGDGTALDLLVAEANLAGILEGWDK